MTLFETFVDILGLTLNEIEENELRLIEEHIQGLPLNVSDAWTEQYRAELEFRLQQTKNVYELVRKFNLQLDIAVNSNRNQFEWEMAYRYAQKTDDATQDLLLKKFKICIVGENAPDLLFILVMGYFSFEFYIKQTLLMLPDVIWNKVNTLSYMLVTMYCLKWVIYSLSEEITFLIIPQLNKQKVLDAAHNAEIKLTNLLPGERLTDSNSMICKIINNRNPFNELTTMGFEEEIPEEMCCAISHTIMTDPVGSKQSRHRFERTVILDWLKIKKIHPCTRLQLTADELTRDFKLKIAIDGYVSEQLSSNKKYQYQSKALLNHSIFQMHAPCSNDIRDEMMPNSAFGQG